MKSGVSDPDSGARRHRAAGARRGPIILRRLVPSTAVLCICAEVLAGDAPLAQQLERMAAAMRTLSYEGTLVYLHDNRLETLRIEHRVENGQSLERIVSLTGPVRIMTRDRERVTCKLTDARPFSVHRRGIAQGRPHLPAIDTEALAVHYLVHPLGATRVAGREAEVIGVIPRDNLRYGYRFYLDTESGLPLKSDLMGEEPEPVEQVMFTSLDLLPSEERRAVPAAPGLGPDDEPPKPVWRDPANWRFSDLPPGFSLVMHDRSEDGAAPPLEHFVVSDGLASVSVYVEPEAAEGLEGESRIGAIHAAGARVSGHQVTVVGEVPAGTVRAVLAGLRREGGE